jgi:hypothetical protein
MSKVVKALVINGRYKGETVRITNISTDEMGKKSAAVFLGNGQRANIKLSDLEMIEEAPAPQPEGRFAKTASMPFVSGASSSRTLTQTKNMQKPRAEIKSEVPSKNQTLALCEICGNEYNLEDRRGKSGKITVCEDCSDAT